MDGTVWRPSPMSQPGDEVDGDGSIPPVRRWHAAEACRLTHYCGGGPSRIRRQRRQTYAWWRGLPQNEDTTGWTP